LNSGKAQAIFDLDASVDKKANVITIESDDDEDLGVKRRSTGSKKRHILEDDE